MADKIYHNPAALLTLFDYTDKGEEPLSIQEKIDLLQDVLRFLSRKDYLSTEDKNRTQQAIKSYELELEYLIRQKKEIQLINDIINLAIKPLKKENKDAARNFMEAYHETRNDKPGLNITQYIKEIGWPEPSSNTQRDWIEKFETAEDVILNSNQ